MSYRKAGSTKNRYKIIIFLNKITRVKIAKLKEK
jgi:hypothetical protein